MPVQVFNSMQNNAPELNGNSASLITVLDAVLVNGYNTLSVSSITRSGSTATVTTSTAHDFVTNDSVAISGATETEYNGKFRITRTGSTTFTYTVTGTPSTPATGTITCKRASAGFEKKYTGTEKAVYRSTRSDSNKHYLRVVDDSTGGASYKSALCYSWESMDDVDTGTVGAPTPNGRHWPKSLTSDSTARWWCIVTDGRLVYYFVGTDVGKTNASVSNTAQCCWGDFKSFKAGDIYNVIHCGTDAYTNSSIKQDLALSVMGTYDSFYATRYINVARAFTAAASVVNNVYILACRSFQVFGSSSGVVPFPNLADAGFYMAPSVLVEPTYQTFRGLLPGVFEPYHGRCFPNNTVFDGVSGMDDRQFLMLYGQHATFIACFVLDITGNASGEWW